MNLKYLPGPLSKKSAAAKNNPKPGYTVHFYVTCKMKACPVVMFRTVDQAYMSGLTAKFI